MVLIINGHEIPPGKSKWGVIFNIEDAKGRRKGHIQQKFKSTTIGGEIETVQTTYRGWWRRPIKERVREYIPPIQKSKKDDTPYQGMGGVRSN